MLHEDVGGAIEKDQKALDEFGRRAPFLGALLGTNVPCPAELTKATGPATQSKEAQPEEDTTLDPVRQAIEDSGSFLSTVCQIDFRLRFTRTTYKEATKGRHASSQSNRAERKNDAINHLSRNVEVLPYSRRSHLGGMAGKSSLACRRRQR